MHCPSPALPFHRNQRLSHSSWQHSAPANTNRSAPDSWPLSFGPSGHLEGSPNTVGLRGRGQDCGLHGELFKSERWRGQEVRFALTARRPFVVTQSERTNGVWRLPARRALSSQGMPGCPAPGRCRRIDGCVTTPSRCQRRYSFESAYAEPHGRAQPKGRPKFQRILNER